MQRDLHNNINYQNAFNTAAISSNTTTNGNWIDISNHEAVEFVIQAGAVTDGDYVPKIQVSQDAAGSHSDAVDIDTDLLLGTYLAATFADDTDDNDVGKIGIRDGAGAGYKYARISLTSTNVTTGGTFGAVAVLGKPRVAPIAYTTPA